jgi:hypothetical protein
VSSELVLAPASVTAITVSAGIAPLILRASGDGTSPVTLSGTIMRPETSVSLEGQHTAGGFVYARHLDGAGLRHAVSFVAPDTTAKLTGQVFSYGFKAAVVGTPEGSFQLGALIQGCDLEPIALSGAEQPHLRDAEAACDVEPIRWDAGAVTANDATLSAGTEVDLTDGGSDVDATHTPPTFFCTHPGSGWAEVQLPFSTASDGVLTTVVSRRDVTCTLAGLDGMFAANLQIATRIKHGPIIPTLAPFGTWRPEEDVVFTSDAYRSGLVALGADGVYYKDIASDRSAVSLASVTLEGPSNSASFASAGNYATPVYGEAQIASKEPQLVAGAIEVAYFPATGGTLTAKGPDSQTLSTEVSAVTALAVEFGTPNSILTEVSFADGTADTVLVRGIIKNGDTITENGFIRWIRASDLPLSLGRRTFNLLSVAEGTALATAGIPPSHYRIGFFNTAWDEARAFWAGGRVVPLAGGTVFEVSDSRLSNVTIASPCPASVATDAVTGCRIGPNEVLLVALEDSVEMFSPIDGQHLGALIEAGLGDPDGFVHVVQNQLDHCLYASQQTTASGNGIWRYNDEGDLLNAAAYVTDAGLTPAGMLNQGPLLYVANQQGGVVPINTFANQGAPRPGPSLLSALDAGALARGVTANANGNLYFSDVASGGDTGRVKEIVAQTTTATDFLTALSQPMQVALDVADTPNLIVAIAGEHAIGTWTFDGDQVRYIDDVYTTEEPVGVWPLLNEFYLVSGTGLGVDAFMPGSHARSAKDTAITADGRQISRVCLP